MGKTIAAIQLPIPRVAFLAQMMCIGRRKDGLACGNVLAFVKLTDGMLVEVVCDKCNARGYAGDRDQYRHLRKMVCPCGTLLAKAHVTSDGIVQIKCRSCGLTSQLERTKRGGYLTAAAG